MCYYNWHTFKKEGNFVNIDQTLDIIEFGIKNYKNPKTNKKLNLLEYYSFTDLSPRDLATLANGKENTGLAFYLREYHEKVYFGLEPLNLEARLGLFHSIRGHVLTADEKLTIKEKLEEEGYPLIDGVFDMAARYYVEGGIDSISKENVQSTVLNQVSKSKSATAKKLILTQN